MLCPGGTTTPNLPQDLPLDTARAVQASMQPPGQVATLVLPSDAAWDPGGAPQGKLEPEPKRTVPSERVSEIAKVLGKGEGVVLLVGSRGFRAEGLHHAAAIGARTGVRVLGDRVNSRMERGAGRYDLVRIPYPVPQAIALLEGTQHMVLAGASVPVGFFGYPDQPSRTAPEDCEYHVLATPEEDVIGALSMLSEEISAIPDPEKAGNFGPPDLPIGDITIEKVWAAVANLMPEDAVVSDESVTSGRSAQAMTAGARPHDWLNITGGSIGQGLPAALGASIACPDRQVFAMESDGSAMYTVQGLWSMAREQCQVLTIMFNNGAYRILQGELERLAPEATGQTSKAMLDLTSPDIDWVSLSQGMGVEASRAHNCEELVDQMRSALVNRGPRFIEVLV